MLLQVGCNCICLSSQLFPRPPAQCSRPHPSADALSSPLLIMSPICTHALGFAPPHVPPIPSSSFSMSHAPLRFPPPLHLFFILPSLHPLPSLPCLPFSDPLPPYLGLLLSYRHYRVLPKSPNWRCIFGLRQGLCSLMMHDACDWKNIRDSYSIFLSCREAVQTSAIVAVSGDGNSPMSQASLNTTDTLHATVQLTH